MIITRTPYRLSLFGGGTDYPAWYRDNGGAVIGFAINKYCYVTVRHLPPFFAHRHRIVYSRIESVQHIKEIEHPAVRAVMAERDIRTGLKIHHDGDLPARSGIGSSSSFTVGLLTALTALEGRISTKRQLAAEAIRIEQEVIGEAVGSQDQIWAAYGGCAVIEFMGAGFRFQPLIAPRPRLAAMTSHFLLFFTGFQRYASDIARTKIDGIQQKGDRLNRMRAMVDEARDIIVTPGRDLLEIGEMLNETWTLKRRLSPMVSNSGLDDIYDTGRRAGALGGKLLGAGGGGFMLFFAPPEKHAGIRRALQGLIEIDVGMDFEGSAVVLYQPNGFEGNPQQDLPDHLQVKRGNEVNAWSQ
jgi:D-glycero-alpha-D-manno-heptose-7-phosphate kinase